MRNSHDPDIPVHRLSERWAEAWGRKSFRIHFLSSIGLLVVGLHAFTRFLLWVEQREGVVLADPVLQAIAPTDFTWLTFALIYLGVASAIVYLCRRPYQLLLAVQAYVLMVAVRAAMMYLVPLNPSEHLIVLRDPIVQLVGDGTALTKDLFFSGHTSTMFLLFLVVKDGMLRKVYLAFTVLVGVFVVWQHVHYVVDVLVAPFVAFACYSIVDRWQMRWIRGGERSGDKYTNGGDQPVRN